MDAHVNLHDTGCACYAYPGVTLSSPPILHTTCCCNLTLVTTLLPQLLQASACYCLLLHQWVQCAARSCPSPLQGDTFHLTNGCKGRHGAATQTVDREEDHRELLLGPDVSRNPPPTSPPSPPGLPPKHSSVATHSPSLSHLSCGNHQDPQLLLLLTLHHFVVALLRVTCTELAGQLTKRCSLITLDI